MDESKESYDFSLSTGFHSFRLRDTARTSTCALLMELSMPFEAEAIAAVEPANIVFFKESRWYYDTAYQSKDIFVRSSFPFSPKANTNSLQHV
jgi:hypothetical protein